MDLKIIKRNKKKRKKIIREIHDLAPWVRESVWRAACACKSYTPWLGFGANNKKNIAYANPECLRCIYVVIL
jgi:hypothetical protein